jgi:hypothetical protein
LKATQTSSYYKKLLILDGSIQNPEQYNEFSLLISGVNLPILQSLSFLTKSGLILINEGYSPEVNIRLIGFWELLRKKPTRIVSVDFYLNSNTPIASQVTRSSTSLLSLSDTRNVYIWKLIPHVTNIAQKALSSDNFDHPLTTALPVFPSPSFLSLIAFLIIQIFLKLYILTRSIVAEERWQVLIAPLKADYKNITPSDFTAIDAPPGHFWADPFIFRKNNETYIFVEDYSYTQGRACIAVGRHDNGKIVDVVPVIEEDYHLSYPFLLEHDGELFMIPESSADRSVKVYKCTRFPDKWVYFKTLFDQKGMFDSTFYFHNGLWWVFANQVSQDGASGWDELYLYYAKNLFDAEWGCHPQNPIISDCTQSRPAGAIFKSNQKIIRPSQCSSGAYGSGINFSEITELTTTTYKEVKLVSYDGIFGWNNVGFHTFNSSDNLTVADGKFWRKK